MRPRLSLPAAALSLAAFCWFAPLSSAAEWQWCTNINSVTSSETNDHPQAFLWIPPHCQRVRAVVVGQHNMLEEGILEHPILRKTLSELGIAEVWITPALDLYFRFDKGAGEHFEEMMQSLADESGYSELKFAPIVPLGHSAAASYPWSFAAWNPGRTLAAISVHGDAPLFKRPGNPDWGNRNIDGIPGLFVMGEYEWEEFRITPALEFEKTHPAAPLTMLADAGHGHFDFSDALVQYIAMFIRKAAQARLPENPPLDKPVSLKPVDPHTGWRADRWHKDAPPTAPAAPYDKYTGDPSQAFWYFDKEMADATERYYAIARGKKPQLVGFVQDGQIVPPKPHTLQGVSLHFTPLADGISFHVGGTFLDTVPPGEAGERAGLTVGAHVGHATGGGPVVVSRICGPVIQTGTDTFAIQFYRMGMNNTKRSYDVWLLASHPGDDQYKSAVQQGNLRLSRNNEGKDQKITFPAIADQHIGTTSLKLNAKSDSGEKVYYYVKAGPAEIQGDLLKFTPVPPRSRLPLKVTVVAWQWGRNVEPRLKTAEPVERSFNLVK